MKAEPKTVEAKPCLCCKLNPECVEYASPTFTRSQLHFALRYTPLISPLPLPLPTSSFQMKHKINNDSLSKATTKFEHQNEQQ